MLGVGGQPREVVVGVPEALKLRGVILGLRAGGFALELTDRRPLFECLDVGDQEILPHPSLIFLKAVVGTNCS